MMLLSDLLPQETLMTILDAFSNKTKPLGLKIFWTKTNIQVFGGLYGEASQSVHACSKDTEVTQSFTDLGIVVHDAGLPY